MAIFDFLKFKEKKQEPKKTVKEYSLLVVDDDKELTESLELLHIPKDDTEVIFVNSAWEAINLLKGKKIDAVLADINMPDMDLLNAALAKSASEIPVFRMSGQYDRFLNLMLQKPFTKEQFVSKILELRELSRLIRKAS